MSDLKRTISYLKRNGAAATFWAVAERKDPGGRDAWQKRTADYPHKVRPEKLFGPKSRADEIEPETEKHLVSILVPAYQTGRRFFKQMIRSVLGQTYKNWQLIIADASPDDGLKSIVDHFNDERIEYVRLSLNEGIAANTNEAFNYAKGDYIGLLDHDDLLAPDAISEVMRAIDEKGYRIVYTDEDKINSAGNYVFEPNFKPGFNLDLLLTNNYICHFAMMEKELFSKLMLRSSFDGAQDYDLFLRAVLGLEYQRMEELEKRLATGLGDGDDDPEDGIADEVMPYGFFPDTYFKSVIGHVPRILYHWRAGEGSTADDPDSKRYAYEAGKRALEDFYRQLDWDVEVSHTPHLGFYKSTYRPDIMTVREDIIALCGRKVRKGKVTESPVLEGVKLFEGMNVHYSGYLHRAALFVDVDKASSAIIGERRKVHPGADRNDMRLVYVPELIVK